MTKPHRMNICTLMVAVLVFCHAAIADSNELAGAETTCTSTVVEVSTVEISTEQQPAASEMTSELCPDMTAQQEEEDAATNDLNIVSAISLFSDGVASKMTELQQEYTSMFSELTELQQEYTSMFSDLGTEVSGYYREVDQKISKLEPVMADITQVISSGLNESVNNVLDALHGITTDQSAQRVATIQTLSALSNSVALASQSIGKNIEYVQTLENTVIMANQKVDQVLQEMVQTQSFQSESTKKSLDALAEQIRKNENRQLVHMRRYVTAVILIMLAGFGGLLYLMRKQKAPADQAGTVPHTPMATENSTEQPAPQAPTPAPPVEMDHRMALQIANEMNRVQRNLDKMDKNIKGWKQLNGTVVRMMDYLASKGYEMPELTGKKYSDGMNAEVRFVDPENDSMTVGTISRVLRPMILYQGKMIQPAKIEVIQ